MTSTIRSAVARAGLAVAMVLAVSLTAAAQTQVRVIRDQATIWRRDARIPATQVKAGTVLDVVGRDGDWYIVLVPSASGGTGDSGIISASLVEPVSGSGTLAQRSTPPRPANSPRPRSFGVFGSAHVGVTSWLAADTFAAVVGHSFGPVYGGGIELRVPGGGFLQGAVERFQETGQRVFVSDGQVFNLGIADTVRVIPIWATIGYRRDIRLGAAYVGAGAGVYLYKETSDFADASENVDDRFASYHALAGVEFGKRSVVRAAIEAQFTTVPNALGTSGASAAFSERNLGGAQVRFKVLVGR